MHNIQVRLPTAITDMLISIGTPKVDYNVQPITPLGSAEYDSYKTQFLTIMRQNKSWF